MLEGFIIPNASDGTRYYTALYCVVVLRNDSHMLLKVSRNIGQLVTHN